VGRPAGCASRSPGKFAPVTSVDYADPAITSEPVVGIDRRAPRTSTVLRLVALVAYVAIFLVYSASQGVPFDREQLALWIIGALAVGCIGKPWRAAMHLVVDWVPFVAVFLAYDYSRGAADALGFSTKVTPQINVDRLLFGGHVPTVWLQEHLYEPHVVRWWDVVVAVTYVTHYFVPLAVAGVLWSRNRLVWKRYVARLMVLSFSAVAFFCVFPTAPPWMASRQGRIGDVERIATRGWGRVGLDSAHSLLSKGQATVNLVAAVPSLHAAYAALVAVTLWPMLRPRWLRAVLLVHPALMVFTIVYGGEHYVADALAGYVLLALACWACARVERWWTNRNEAITLAATDGHPSKPKRSEGGEALASESCHSTTTGVPTVAH
jgi:PAP2 superfamily